MFVKLTKFWFSEIQLLGGENKSTLQKNLSFSNTWTPSIPIPTNMKNNPQNVTKLQMLSFDSAK